MVWFVDATSKAMALESQVNTISLGLRGANAMAREAEERAEVVDERMVP